MEHKDKDTYGDTYGALILVVDDEPDIRALLRILLEKEGWRVAEAADGKEAVDYVNAHAQEVSLVVMDIMMPEMDGISTAAALRDMTDAPILFLTARSSDSDKVAAYRSGGDDYMVKPFHATDLRLKLRAMLTRYTLYLSQQAESRASADKADDCHFVLGDGVCVDTEDKTVYKGKHSVPLTDREFDLLCYFCQHRGEILTPAVLYEEVWGESYLSTASNTVIVHIANLRKKLEMGSIGQTLIRTVWGKGYRLD